MSKAKPGRPALYGTAMTGAERARAYRHRRADRQRLALRSPSEATLAALVDELKESARTGYVDGVRRITGELIRRTENVNP